MNRQEIGSRLRAARENKSLSRGEVAKRVDIGTTTLQQWETGGREASLETLEKLSRLYDVTPHYLIFGENTSTDNAPQATYSHDTDDLSDEYAYIPSSMRVPEALVRQVIACVDDLAADFDVIGFHVRLGNV